MIRKLIFVACAALFTGILFAHGNEQHVMGTVTKVSEDSVMVQTTAKVMVEVKILAETKLTRNNASVGLKDVQVGDRVVIHAKRVGNALQADTVQIGVSKSPPHSR